MNIIKVSNKKDIKKLANLAREIWHEYFPVILSTEQIDYMYDKFQSEQAINEQIANGYQYYFFSDAGYIGIQIQDDRLFLSKFYIKQSHRGKGYARIAFEFIKEFCFEHAIKSIYLTVNKYNKNSIAIYEKFGFEQVDAVVKDVGNGYVMDDYIYEYKITLT